MVLGRRIMNYRDGAAAYGRCSIAAHTTQLLSVEAADGGSGFGGGEAALDPVGGSKLLLHALLGGLAGVGRLNVLVYSDQRLLESIE